MGSGLLHFIHDAPKAFRRHRPSPAWPVSAGWRDRLLGQGWLPAVLRSDASAGAPRLLGVRPALEGRPGSAGSAANQAEASAQKDREVPGAVCGSLGELLRESICFGRYARENTATIRSWRVDGTYGGDDRFACIGKNRCRLRLVLQGTTRNDYHGYHGCRGD
jgi:hypothetical protein